MELTEADQHTFEGLARKVAMVGIGNCRPVEQLAYKAVMGGE